MNNKITQNLIKQKCKPCEGGVDPIPETQVHLMLNGLSGWSYTENRISKEYKFKDHYQTLAFVNALAWISHREDHHPNLSVGYKTCNVSYTTDAINGLSENDFICAAKVDYLFDL
ncbi:MAG: 4a-hydroxytetrahydrobiopterin dehydratase [Proteobacteria bacterium]|nr:4a-hydroxytetrahydrobiopterin dehydratase [Pseudomonadota bacterium]MDA1331150.1 4a-hydroxytetrahydrobiopterin dehydratase [Pseudomonadota bacterium]